VDAANSKSYSGSGNDWYDLSGNGYDGTITGATYYSENEGKFLFNGSDGHVSISGTTNLNLTSKISISFWCYNISTPTGYASHHISKCQNGTTSNSNFVNYFYKSAPYTRMIDFGANRGGTWGPVSPMSPALELNTWYNIGWSYDSVIGGRLFLNGYEVSGGPVGSGTLASNTDPIRIGHYFYPGHNYYNGYISCLSIYNTNLSSNDFLQNYNSTKGRFGL